MSTQEGNTLIDVFMGEDGFLGKEFEEHYSDEFWRPTKHKYEPKNLEYHSSWDWLMPVVEKICNTEMTFKLESVFEWDNKEKYNPKYQMEIRDGGYHLKGSDKSKVLIEVVYQSVIQFVQWYNSNQK